MNPKSRRDAEAEAPSTRERILSAALDEFAEHGIAGARVDEIAQRAEVNKQALYYYFGSKELLFQAALSYGYAKDLGSLDLADDPSMPAAAAMGRLIEMLFDHFRGHRNMMQMLAHENRAKGAHLSPEVREEVRAAIAPILDGIRTILRRGQKQRVFASRIDPTQFYLTIVATCMFYFANAHTMSAILGEDLLADAAITRRRRHLRDILVAGIRSQPNG